MRWIRVFLLGATLSAGAACASLDENVRDAARDYRSIRKSMKRSEVYLRLGQPDHQFPSGDASWVTGRRCQRAELRVSFDQAGRVSRIDRHVTR